MTKRRSLSAPAALVGAIGVLPGRGSRRKKRGLLGLRRPRPAVDLSVAADVAHRVSSMVPRGRRRKRMVRRLKRRLDRATGLLNGAATVVGLAAAGAELVSAMRPGGAETDRAARGRDDDDRDEAWDEEPDGAPRDAASNGTGRETRSHRGRQVSGKHDEVDDEDGDGVVDEADDDEADDDGLDDEDAEEVEDRDEDEDDRDDVEVDEEDDDFGDDDAGEEDVGDDDLEGTGEDDEEREEALQDAR